MLDFLEIVDDKVVRSCRLHFLNVVDRYELVGGYVDDSTLVRTWRFCR